MKCSSCSAPVVPVFVTDLDDTLADWTDCFFNFLSWWLPSDLSEPLNDGYCWEDYDGSQEISEFLKLPKALYREAKLAFRQGGYKRRMDYFPNESGMALTHAAAGLGCEIWIATTRPWQRLDNVDPDTREWLAHKGITYDGIIYGDDKYKQLLERIELDRIVMVLDNDAEQIALGLEDGLPMCFRGTHWNRGVTAQADWWYVNNLRTAREQMTMRVAKWKEQHGG